MASVKISVESLNQQKREYEKAVKNLENALWQIKKVSNSLGTDAMLEDVRKGLVKLSASLETRAEVLLLMTKALEQSGEKYTAAQKKAVTKSNQFRAHHQDFYGNPVVVTVATAATATAATAAATAASTASVPVSGADSGVSVQASGTDNGMSATISQVSENARNIAASAAGAAGTSKPAADPVVVESTGSVFLNEEAVTGEVDTGSSGPGANVFVAGAVAGAAAGAAVGGIAGGAVGALVNQELKKAKQAPKQAPGQAPKPVPGQAPKPAPKQAPKPVPDQAPKPVPKKQEPPTDIEAQLEAARERLRRFNEMEEKK